MSGYFCPKCRYGIVMTERRPFGDSTCGACKHTAPTVTFLDTADMIRDRMDMAENSFEKADREERRAKIEKAVDEAWEKNR